MNTPPPITAPLPRLIPGPSAGAARAQQIALFSVLGPAVGIGINVADGPAVHGDRLAMLMVGLIATLLILAGFVVGIVALVSTRKHCRKGMIGKALTGIGINGLLIVFRLISIPVLMKAGERPKAIQGQKASEQAVQASPKWRSPGGCAPMPRCRWTVVRGFRAGEPCSRLTISDSVTGSRCFGICKYQELTPLCLLVRFGSFDAFRLAMIAFVIEIESR